MTELRLPGRPRLVVTVDAEGDDLWSRPATVTTENAGCLPRFQRLCDRHGVRPSYLATYEMAASETFQAFGRQVLRDDAGEIGMHLHAWNSPPLVPLTERDHWHQPYATLYPQEAIDAKIALLTGRLQDAFGTAIGSHRAGRWAFNAAYARLLAAHGYYVDSSVTPHVSWRRLDASPIDRSAPDYTGYPETPYWLDPFDPGRPGTSRLLEVPMTTVRVALDGPAQPRPGAEGAAATPDAPPYVVRWLRPNGRNLRALQWVAREALDAGRPVLVLMLHSSDLLPGGSPSSSRPEDVEALYSDLDTLFAWLSAVTSSVTLSELYRQATAGD